MKKSLPVLFFLLAAPSFAAVDRVTELYEEGLIHFNRDRYENALYYFIRAVQENEAARRPKNYLHYRAAGKCLEKLDRFHEAEEYYTESLKLKSDQPDLLLYLGLGQRRARRFREAEDYFQRYLKLVPADPEATLLLALALAEDDRQKDAATLLQKSSRPSDLKKDCIRLEYTAETETAAHRKKRLAEAAECWRKQLALNPADRETYIALDRMGLRPAEKRYTYADYLAVLFSDSADAQWPRFWHLHENRKFNDALDLLNRIGKLSPSDPMVPLLRGDILRELGKMPEAENSFQEALQLAGGKF